MQPCPEVIHAASTSSNQAEPIREAGTDQTLGKEAEVQGIGHEDLAAAAGVAAIQRKNILKKKRHSIKSAKVRGKKAKC